MWPNPQQTADLVTFTEEILYRKLHFLFRVVFSGSYFAVIGLNKEIYGVNLLIQSENGEFGLEKASVRTEFEDLICKSPYSVRVRKKCGPEKIMNLENFDLVYSSICYACAIRSFT